MKNTINTTLALLLSFSMNAWAAKSNSKKTNAKAKAEVTEAKAAMSTPDFSLKGHDGKTYKLSEVLKEGKHVVLEWFNNECPYVKKHYDSGNMQAIQKKYTDQGVKWFTIVSSAKGKQGFMTIDSAAEIKKSRKQNATAILLDPSGKVGRLYGAKTTPHMFVISPKGDVVYKGAIDSNSSYKPKTIAGATNYVAVALDASMGGKKVSKPTTKPYGCSVKY